VKIINLYRNPSRPQIGHVDPGADRAMSQVFGKRNGVRLFLQHAVFLQKSDGSGIGKHPKHNGERSLDVDTRNVREVFDPNGIGLPTRPGKLNAEWEHVGLVIHKLQSQNSQVAFRKMGQLSGGERNRVHLAKLLRGGGNLLLDEPTNDLDVNTLRSLEEGLISFGGCAVVISHNRWFLDRVATHILAFEGDSKVVWFEGNFEDYHEHRRELLADEADRPHRVKFRPVSHR